MLILLPVLSIEVKIVQGHPVVVVDTADVYLRLTVNP